MAKLTAEELLFRKVEEKVKKAIYEYGLIADGDRILIGLSGGKDSLALLDLLGRRSKIYHPRFEVVVAHIVMTNIPYCSDIIETLLMNMTHQGAFGTMPPRLKMDKFDMEIIRPMCLIEEKELIRIAAWKGYRKQIKNCPYESGSSRSDMKEVLARLEAINPEARYSIWSSMSNIQHDYLPQKKK